MNVFELNSNLIGDYFSYLKGFIRIKDNRIDELVEKHLDEGLLWPAPLIQLNPSFEEGAYIDGLQPKGNKLSCRTTDASRCAWDSCLFAVTLRIGGSEL